MSLLSFEQFYRASQMLYEDLVLDFHLDTATNKPSEVEHPMIKYFIDVEELVMHAISTNID